MMMNQRGPRTRVRGGKNRSMKSSGKRSNKSFGDKKKTQRGDKPKKEKLNKAKKSPTTTSGNSLTTYNLSQTPAAAAATAARVENKDTTYANVAVSDSMSAG